jgi:hypothetical protein
MYPAVKEGHEGSFDERHDIPEWMIFMDIYIRARRGNLLTANLDEWDIKWLRTVLH